MIEIRRTFTHVEDIHHEFGPVADVPLKRGYIGVVLTNPFAGRYEPDNLPMIVRGAWFAVRKSARGTEV